MITKIGRRLTMGKKPVATGKKLMLLPIVAAASALRFPENYDASMHYVDPMDNTYYREPGIIYDSLKRNPYVHA